MSTVATLLRSDLRDFGGYKSARTDKLQGEVWLNANESPWANAGTPDSDLRRYPSPQPEGLRDALARLYGVKPDRLLVGRGSDEGIDPESRLLAEVRRRQDREGEHGGRRPGGRIATDQEDRQAEAQDQQLGSRRPAHQRSACQPRNGW